VAENMIDAGRHGSGGEGAVPKPINDPRQDHLSVVIAFTVPPHGRTPEQFRARILAKLPALLGYRVGPPEGLSVGVRVVGSQGERSEMEGEGP
jgi:hypothetical protein